MSPISKPEILRDFYRHFLKGYRTENELDPFWIEQLGTFLSYRRLLLYTVLQGWLSNDRAANDAFLSMIKNPPGTEFLVPISVPSGYIEDTQVD